MSCVIKHNWEYYKEEFDPSYEVGNLKINYALEKVWVRKCKRCNKKQEACIGTGTFNFKLKKYCFWVPCVLTVEEIRDFKLKK